MKTEKFTFPNAQGEQLAAHLHMPDKKPKAYALFAHCFTCSKNFVAVERISEALTEDGIGVFSFDFTGLGESEGDFSDTNFSSNIDDLIFAAEYMKKHYAAPVILIGHSLGGAAVIQAAQRIPLSKAVITIGAPAEPGHVTKHIMDDFEKIKKEGQANVTLAGRTFTIKKQFLDDLEKTNMHTAVGSLGKALLIFHSPKDEIVGIENASLLFKYAKHPKSFISLDNANHLLTNKEDAIFVAGVIASWSRRYI